MNEKKLAKSKRDCKIAGVCGGIGEYFDIDPTIVRLVWAICTCVAGSGILLYIVAALILPEGTDVPGAPQPRKDDNDPNIIDM